MSETIYTSFHFMAKRFLNICNRSRKLRTLKMNCNNILLLTFYLKVPAKFIIRHYLKLKY